MPYSSARRIFYQTFARVHHALLIRTHGRPVHMSPRLRALVLVTIGRKSGSERKVTLLYMPEGNDFVVLASNWGQEHPPAWWLNLEARPEAVVEHAGRSIPVVARELRGDERTSILTRALSHNKQWRTYVDDTQREIPVVLLERGPVPRDG